jgi:hypothetical protein
MTAEVPGRFSPHELETTLHQLSERCLHAHEIIRLLHHFPAYGIRVTSPAVKRPPSGSFFFYLPGVKVRDDDHAYARKMHQNGSFILKEQCLKLVVRGTARLACYTSMLSDRPSFRRRIYRLLDSEYSLPGFNPAVRGVSFVHYLDSDTLFPATFGATPFAALTLHDSVGASAQAPIAAVTQSLPYRQRSAMLPGIGVSSSDDDATPRANHVGTLADLASSSYPAVPAPSSLVDDGWGLSGELEWPPSAAMMPPQPAAHDALLFGLEQGAGSSAMTAAALDMTQHNDEGNSRSSGSDGEWATVSRSDESGGDEAGSDGPDDAASRSSGDVRGDAASVSVEGRTNRLLQRLMAQVRGG